MGNNFIIRFSPKAKKDLEKILNYINDELSNPIAAKSFSLRLFQKLDYLIEFPELGSIVVNKYINETDLRHTNVGYYSIYYIVENDISSIIIIRIIFSKRNTTKEWLLNENIIAF